MRGWHGFGKGGAWRACNGHARAWMGVDGRGWAWMGLGFSPGMREQQTSSSARARSVAENMRSTVIHIIRYDAIYVGIITSHHIPTRPPGPLGPRLSLAFGVPLEQLAERGTITSGLRLLRMCELLRDESPPSRWSGSDGMRRDGMGWDEIRWGAVRCDAMGCDEI
ncbi:hypothetical protein AOQ84DRAFT_50925 [Glonium stellatum]|uniref:Uncharacterized protein n=1 Tax=Glonium stellatum TaxID=574774 RepID=A0A8E2JYD2_9PEZI|nr:hypothetical protein AOQ84DRAFT_50925 [Glonium stellatum]